MEVCQTRKATRRKFRRKVFRNQTHRRNYQNLLVALYLTSDEHNGIACLYNYASNASIAESAGLKAPTVTAYLREFEADGHIATFMPGEFGICLRVIVLKDHPKARAAIREFHERYGPGKSSLVHVHRGA